MWKRCGDRQIARRRKLQNLERDLIWGVRRRDWGLGFRERNREVILTKGNGAPLDGLRESSTAGLDVAAECR